MSKLTKEQKREIDLVVRKYLPKLGDGWHAETSLLGFFGGVVGCVGSLVADIALTGGVITLSSGLAGATGMALGLAGGIKSGIYFQEKKKGSVNCAGQVYMSGHTVRETLQTMERKLYKAFRRVAKNEIPYSHFKSLGDEIENDVKKLSPVFKIISGGENGYGTDKFEFVLDYKQPEILKPKIKTLADEQALTAFPALSAPRLSALMKLVK